MNKPQHGLTMLEVMIASIILVAVSAMAMQLLYFSSNHVTNMEVGVRMEQSAREVIAAISADLRQSKMSTVEIVNTTLGPLYTTNNPLVNQALLANQMTDTTTLPGTQGTRAATLASSGSPTYYTSTYSPSCSPAARPYGAAGSPAGSGPNNTLPADWRSGPPAYVIMDGTVTTPCYEGQFVFNGIRFRTPDKQMDLTSQTANADLNNPNSATGQDNFNLTNFKSASQVATDWTREVQYWWEADAVVAGTPLSAGVVKKAETLRTSTGVLIVRHVTTIARNVSALQFMIPMYTANVDPVKDAALWMPQPLGSAGVKPAFANNYKYSTALPEKQIFVGIQMQQPDPKYPKKIITRYLTSTVEVRN